MTWQQIVLLAVLQALLMFVAVSPFWLLVRFVKADSAYRDATSAQRRRFWTGPAPRRRLAWGGLISVCVGIAVSYSALGSRRWPSRSPTSAELPGRYEREGEPAEFIELRTDGTYVAEATVVHCVGPSSGHWRVRPCTSRECDLELTPHASAYTNGVEPARPPGPFSTYAYDGLVIIACIDKGSSEGETLPDGSFRRLLPTR